MSEWEEKRLEEICTKITKGTTPTTLGNAFVNSGINFIKSESITNSKFLDKSKYAFIDEITYHKLNRSKIEVNDILFSMAGMFLGKIAVVQKKDVPANTNQAVAIIRINKQCADYSYIYYYLSQKHITDYINLSTAQSAQPNINLAQIGNLPVKLPPIPTQQKIANILSAYDDLIENNNRRIELLEKAAQNLYKEWFVRFRFPNYKQTKFENGLPEGWKVAKLGDVAEINSKSISKQFKHSTINYIDISSVQSGQILSKTKYFLNDAPGRAKRIVNGGDVIWAMVRPNLKAYSLIISPNENDIVSTGFAVISARKAPFTFIYCTVTTQCFIDYLINHAKGSAYPAVTAKEFENAKIILPCDELLSKFHTITEDLYMQKQILLEQNCNLIKQRDLLLPRLMSGKLKIPQ